MYAKIINPYTVEPAPKCTHAISGFDRLPAHILAEYGYYELINDTPADGALRATYTLDDSGELPVIRQTWEAVELPPAIPRFDTKKVIEKMRADGLLAPVRDALLAQGLYEIMLLERLLSMDDERFRACLELIAPIALENGVEDVEAWLEDCKV